MSDNTGGGAGSDANHTTHDNPITTASNDARSETADSSAQSSTTGNTFLSTHVLVVGSGTAAYLSACAFACRGFHVTLFANATVPVYPSTPVLASTSASSTPSKLQSQQQLQRDQNFVTPTKSPSSSRTSSVASPATPPGSSAPASSPEARYVSLCASGKAAMTRFAGLDRALYEAREKTRLQAVHVAENVSTRSDANTPRSISEIGGGVHASIPFAAAAAESCCSSFVSNNPRVHRLSGRISVEDVDICERAFISLSLSTPSGRTTLRTRVLVAADGDAPWSILWHLSQRAVSSHVGTHADNLVLKPVRADRKATPGAGASQTLGDDQSERILRRTIQVTADRANLLVHPSRALVVQPARGLSADRAFRLYMYPSFSGSRDRVACVHADLNHYIWTVSTVDEMYELFDLNFPSIDCRKLISKKAMWTFVESRAKPILVAKCLYTPAVLVSERPGASSSASDNVSAVLFVGRSARVLPPDSPASLDSMLVDAATVADALGFVLAAKGRDNAQFDDSSLNKNLRSLVKKYIQLRSEELKALVQVVSQVASLRGDNLVPEHNDTQATATGSGSGSGAARCSQSVTPKTGRIVKQSAAASRLSKQGDFNQLLLDQSSFVEMLRLRRMVQRRSVGASIIVPTVAAGLVRLVFRATTRLLGGAGAGRRSNFRRRSLGSDESGSDSDGDSDGD